MPHHLDPSEAAVDRQSGRPIPPDVPGRPVPPNRRSTPLDLFLWFVLPFLVTAAVVAVVLVNSDAFKTS